MFAASIKTFSRWFFMLSGHAKRVCRESRHGSALSGRRKGTEGWMHLDG